MVYPIPWAKTCRWSSKSRKTSSKELEKIKQKEKTNQNYSPKLSNT